MQVANDRLMVDPTSSVQSTDGGAFPGRLGYLLLDQSVEKLIALTASQLAGARLVSTSTGRKIGFSSSNRMLRDSRLERRPADTMLMPVILEEGIGLSPVQICDENGDPLLPTDWIRNTAGLLGQTVLIHTSKALPRLARVASTQGHFIMPVDRDDNEVHFNRAIELCGIGDEPLTKAGDAGCLVTTRSGEAIGVIICGVDEVSFAAPISRVIDELQDCTGITRDMIANDAITITEEQEASAADFGPVEGTLDVELEAMLAEHLGADKLDEIDAKMAERMKDGGFF